VIARDSRRMKHIFVVKKGSLAIWKRLDPDGPLSTNNNHELNSQNNEKSSLSVCVSIKIMFDIVLFSG
jgi:hypothetical protein